MIPGPSASPVCSLTAARPVSAEDKEAIQTAITTETIRQRLDAYTKEKYGIEPEVLPFSHEDYEIYRHTESGKWFAVFIVKERSAFGLEGDGAVEVLCVKLQDPLLGDYLMRQPGYLRGYPSSKWNWVTMVLDGMVPFEDICRWLDESYKATKTKAKNRKTPLSQRGSQQKAEQEIIKDER